MTTFTVNIVQKKLLREQHRIGGLFSCLPGYKTDYTCLEDRQVNRKHRISFSWEKSLTKG